MRSLTPCGGRERRSPGAWIIRCTSSSHHASQTVPEWKPAQTTWLQWAFPQPLLINSVMGPLRAPTERRGPQKSHFMSPHQSIPLWDLCWVALGSSPVTELLAVAGRAGPVWMSSSSQGGEGCQEAGGTPKTPQPCLGVIQMLGGGESQDRSFPSSCDGA